MPAYSRQSAVEFLNTNSAEILGHLQQQYAKDGYATQFSKQTEAWVEIVELLKKELAIAAGRDPAAKTWTVLLEYPLYRLQKRLDIVVLVHSSIVVVEAKVGNVDFNFADKWQVEEYSLALRDFHEQSHKRTIVPVLWCTGVNCASSPYNPGPEDVKNIQYVGREGLADVLLEISKSSLGEEINGFAWDFAPYHPVPTIVEAATAIFSGHDVREIGRSDAANLRQAASRIIQLIVEARDRRENALIFLTGVPGSGKTLAGLQVVHDAITTGVEQRGDIVFLSGNTPLLTVLREALSRDEFRRGRDAGHTRGMALIRREVQTRIQHINNFLKESLTSDQRRPPHEHTIVFDEAQRAWDEKQGDKKFNRTESEPSLLLELMSRHADWCACVCLIGEGQEINVGEQGLPGWGDTLRKLDPAWAARWVVYAAPAVLNDNSATDGRGLGQLPPGLRVNAEPDLQLDVPVRSYRCPQLNEWVRYLLNDAPDRASEVASDMGEYPLFLTRSLERAREWLKSKGRGHRRYGLVASSGARRLRAEGLGEILTAMDKMAIAHWYLNRPGDIRSSYALEVPANEFTCQGLELDFVGVCWGGDLIRNPNSDSWIYQRLNGASWQTIKDPVRRQFIQNTYRVLLSRAREGMVIYVPEGDSEDVTRPPGRLNATAEFLTDCGVRTL